jgi:hypothetical protein
MGIYTVMSDPVGWLHVLVPLALGVVGALIGRIFDSTTRSYEARIAKLEDVAQLVQQLRESEARNSERDVHIQSAISQLMVTMTELSGKLQTVVLGQARLEDRIENLRRP